MVKLLLQGSSGPEVVELRKRLAKTLGADAKMFALPSNSAHVRCHARLGGPTLAVEYRHHRRWCRRSLLPEPVGAYQAACVCAAGR